MERGRPGLLLGEEEPADIRALPLRDSGGEEPAERRLGDSPVRGPAGRRRQAQGEPGEGDVLVEFRDGLGERRPARVARGETRPLSPPEMPPDEVRRGRRPVEPGPVGRQLVQGIEGPAHRQGVPEVGAARSPPRAGSPRPEARGG